MCQCGLISQKFIRLPDAHLFGNMFVS